MSTLLKYAHFIREYLNMEGSEEGGEDEEYHAIK